MKSILSDNRQPDSPGGCLEGTQDTPYRVHLSHEADNRLWDEFLSQVPGGHYVQTSMWGQVKSLLGWRSVRIIVKQGEHIVAGAQLLTRRFPLLGDFAVVTKGPVIASNDTSLPRLVLEEVHRFAMEQGIQCIVIQPPNNGEALADLMCCRGFKPTTLEVAPTATALIDLAKGQDEIFSCMKKKARRYIRHGLSHGMVGREGTAEELENFYRMLTATSRRQKWPIYSDAYFAEIVRIFARRDHAKLFFTEYGGEVVSAQLLIGFGDTVIAKNSGWSGLHGSLGPNQVLEWKSIQWAKAQGYRYYDLEGLHPEVVEAILNGQSVEGSAKHSWCQYKLQYGGKVTLFPKAYAYFYNPVLRWASRWVLGWLENRSIGHMLLNFVRLR